MCGRFLLHAPVEALEAQFQAVAACALEPRYNLAPTDAVAVVKETRVGRVLCLHRWGLVPSWAQDPALGSRLANARAETAADKPSFRAAFRRRRCLLPASGFFEWQVRPGAAKQPYHIHPAGGGILALAGLWERWEGPEGGLESCSILTTEANAFMAPVHDRMPVILAPRDWQLWLDPALGEAARDRERLQSLLRPCPEDLLRRVPVSARVGNVRNQGPDLLEPLLG